MWDTYAPEPGSICCVTTVRKLWQSLDLKLELANKNGDSEDTAQKKPDQDFIPCGLVRYYSPKFLNCRDDASRPIRPVFYRPGDIGDRCYYSTEFVKRDCFSFEKEARFICFGDGHQMTELNELGRLVKFKDLRLQSPFLRIIARPDIAPSVYSELQDLFGCSLTLSEVSGHGRPKGNS